MAGKKKQETKKAKIETDNNVQQDSNQNDSMTKTKKASAEASTSKQKKSSQSKEASTGAISLDQPVPDFLASATGEKEIQLSSFQGSKNVIIYFYPKDSTPGCTKEGQNFRDNYEKFQKLDTVILGVSRDSLKSHDNFKTKQNFPFDLLSDKDEVVSKIFGTLTGTKLNRQTFLIDKNGILRQEWRKVTIANHCEEVLQAVHKLEKKN